VSVAVSHCGVAPAVQLAVVRHWTHLPGPASVTLQTRAPATTHWLFIVQVGTHAFVVVSQTVFVGQLASPTHTTHTPAEEQ
jgi:hypothetical protein